jgi:mono/diheme cytochrome c family protein
MKMKKFYLIPFLLVLGLILAGGAMAQELPKGPGANLVYAKCQTCHDLQYIIDSKGISRADWEDLVQEMEGYGLQLTPEEEKQIIEYLATYLGPNPPPPPKETESTPKALDGKKLYAQNCAGCHQAGGQGVPGAFPPLANNPYVVKDRAYPALVVLFGLTGPIEVNGQSFNGTMPAFGHLSDAEIAAILKFVRTELNAKLLPKDFKHLTAEEIKALRAKKLTPEQVHAHREKIKVK